MVIAVALIVVKPKKSAGLTIEAFRRGIDAENGMAVAKVKVVESSMGEKVGVLKAALTVSAELIGMRTSLPRRLAASEGAQKPSDPTLLSAELRKELLKAIGKPEPKPSVPIIRAVAGPTEMKCLLSLFRIEIVSLKESPLSQVVESLAMNGT
jgi:hypothetical protein